MVRPRVSELSHLALRADGLARAGARLALLLAPDAGRGPAEAIYPAGEIAGTLAIPVQASIPADPRGAADLIRYRGELGRIRRAPLARAAASLAAALAAGPGQHAPSPAAAPGPAPVPAHHPAEVTAGDTADSRTPQPGTGHDHELTQRLRGDVARRLAREAAGPDGAQPLTPARRAEIGRRLIAEALDAEAARALTDARAPLDAGTERQIGQAVFDAIFGLGGFQPFLDDPDVESVNANGCDEVFVQYAGAGGSAPRPSRAATPS